MKFSLSAVALFTFGFALTVADAALPPDASNPIVDVNNALIVKVDATNGNVVWSNVVFNDGALAVDPIDFSIYTAMGGHSPGTDGSVYKLLANGVPAWANSITINSYCDFDFVTNAAVDGTSSNPGVVWSESGCFGAIAKSDRATGAQQWSVLTYDLDRPSIDPFTGQIYAITNAGLNYDAETIYGVTADGTLNYAASCEGYSDLNPADGMLYRGGRDAGSRGCGTTLSQLNSSILGAVNWSMDLSGYVTSVDGIAVQPWQNGYVYVVSTSSSKILVINPATRGVVRSFNSAIVPAHIAVDPANGNIFVADNSHPYLIAYSQTGALRWVNPDLGGTVSNLVTAKPFAAPTPTPTATPTPTPPCGAPTARISSDRNSIHKGETATITIFPGGSSALPCGPVTVFYTVKSRAQQGVDYTITDVNGQVITTGQVTNGPLLLHNLPNSRRRTLPVNIVLIKDRAYYLGNTSVSVQLLATGL